MIDKFQGVGIMKWLTSLRANFGWKRNAGLICIHNDYGCIHLLVQKGHWIFGHETEAYDMIAEKYGIGPLALLVVYNY